MNSPQRQIDAVLVPKYMIRIWLLSVTVGILGIHFHQAMDPDAVPLAWDCYVSWSIVSVVIGTLAAEVVVTAGFYLLSVYHRGLWIYHGTILLTHCMTQANHHLSRSFVRLRHLVSYRLHHAYHSFTRLRHGETSESSVVSIVDESATSHESHDCACCFQELEKGTAMSCNSDADHLVCQDCVRMQVENVLGLGRSHITCFAATNCTGIITDSQLERLLEPRQFERLQEMQRKAVVAAAPDDVARCPSCHYTLDESWSFEIMPVFYCDNKECGKALCRQCGKEGHPSLTCEQTDLESKTQNARHTIEEAMSEALKRQCNSCKQAFIKDEGCNMMTCPQCRNKQCYVCNENVKGHSPHFGPGSKCPLFEDEDARHRSDVQRAQQKATKAILQQNPDVPQDALVVQLSDAAQRAEDRRRDRAAAVARLYDPRHRA